MKKINYFLAIPISVSLLMSSCAVNKITEFQKVLEAKGSKEMNDKPFVLTKEGRIIEYNSLELKKGPFASPHLVANGNSRIQTSMIRAYQTKDHFAISQTALMGGKKSFVAVDALPGFAVRLVKGKLNVYSKKYFNGRAAVDEFYIQLGNDGQIYAYSPELMKELIKESEQASSYFGSVDKVSDLEWGIKNTAEIFNSTKSMTIK